MEQSRTYEQIKLDERTAIAILAATRDEKPSVVQIRSDDVSPHAIGVPVVAAVRQMAVELHEGALLTIDTGRARLRGLPLQAKR